MKNLNTKTLAKMLGVPRVNVKLLVEQEAIKAKKLKGRWSIDPVSGKAFVRVNRKKN